MYLKLKITKEGVRVEYKGYKMQTYIFVFCRSQLVDPDTREEIAEPNRPGELLILGGCATYWNDPEATKASYEDGWYKTGDLFYFDDDGYYFALGRIKEMFKYKTFQVGMNICVHSTSLSIYL